MLSCYWQSQTILNNLQKCYTEPELLIRSEQEHSNEEVLFFFFTSRSMPKNFTDNNYVKFALNWIKALGALRPMI